MKSRLRLALGISLPIVFLISYVSYVAVSGSASVNGPGDSGALQEVCLQLKWSHQAQFAGFYTAAEEGFYRREGLRVRFVEGGPGTDWQERMKDPSCPIGITNAYEIVIASEVAAPVLAVAAIDQVSPIVVFTLKQSGIYSPRQLRGRSLAIVPTGKLQIIGMLGKVGLGLKDIKPAPFSVDLSRLYSGQVDAWSGYDTNLVTAAREEGHEVNVLHPADYGIQIYDDVIYARKELIRRSPDLLKRFLWASLDGWMRAIKDPDAAAAHTLKYTGGGQPEHQRALLVRTIPYIHTGEVPAGWMEASVWKETASLARLAGLVKREPEPEELFTDSFIRDIYGNRDY